MSCNNSCNNCSCNNTENSYEDSEDIPEYQEFIPDKKYSVGEFFKINKEVFKVIERIEGCNNCDLLPERFDAPCGQFSCENVIAILYDTIED